MTLLAIVAATLVAAPAANASISTTPDPATWGTNGTVFAVVRTGSTLYLGGTFTSVVSPDGSQTQPRSGLAAIDLATGQPTPWDPELGGLTATAYAMAVSADGTTMFVGGDFTTVGGESRSRLAAIDLSTGDLVSSWSGGFDGRVRALAVDGNRVYVGGSFEHWNATTTRLRLAAVDATNGSLLAWAPPANNTVRSIVVAPDGRIIVGGFFTEISGDATQQYIAALAADGTLRPWTNHPDRPVVTMSQANGTVYSGSGGEPGGYAWAHDASTGALVWSVPSDGDVQAIGLADGRVVAGGHFIGIGTETSHHLAALDPATGVVDPTWAPNLNGPLGVAAMAMTPETLYVGGDFTTVGGAPYRSIAAFALTDGPNAPPTVSISTPPEGATFKTSDRVALTATANDFEDGALTASIVWSSDLDGRLGSGGTLARRLSLGTHRITAKVKDSSGVVATRTVGVTVVNSKPRIRIASPIDGSSWRASDRISFQASASDFDDGDLTSAISWASDIDGPLGNGGSLARTLSPGTHTVTASVTDSGGGTSAAVVSIRVAVGNQPPAVTITAPTDGTTAPIGSRLSFTGSAADPEQGDVSAGIAWTSSLDGALGTGPSIVRRLSEGTHTIRAKATDTSGAVARATITVIVGNAAPTVTITSPADGATVETGTPVEFHATASDAEDGDLTTSIAWESDRDGGLGTGGSCTRALSIGTHTVTATIVDSRGSVSTATVTVTVAPANTPPSVAITSPADGSQFRTRDHISFAATATDAESGDLSSSVQWSSSVDGPLGAGAAVTARLSRGTHTVTARITDGGGLTQTASITLVVSNTAPQVFVTSPGPGTSYRSDDSISFQGSATDFDDGDLTDSIEWSSSIDGVLGTGGGFTKVLSQGTHTIRAKVTDADGAVARASLTITVGNTPPTLAIQAPANGASFRTVNLVAFQATATDADDGVLTASIAWSSDLDGPLGTGGSFTKRLSQGTHTITASVSDASGATRTATVTVSVANSAPSITLSSPANAASYSATDAIAFQATASDFDDGPLTSGIVWTSNIDHGIGTGGSFVRSLSAGTHTITATATDSDGASRSASVTIAVGDAAPIVSILTPATGTSFETSDDIAFQGRASDRDDGDLTASIVWTSDRVGVLGSGGALAARLPPGANVVTASVTDGSGARRTASVSVTVANAPPEIAISRPGSGAAFTTSDDIRLEATASDFDDGDLTPSITWTSDVDGVLGTGGTLTKHLSRGAHTITASVVDADGSARMATIAITVANAPPSVAISSPIDGTSTSTHSTITFSATASDFDDGDVTATIVWTSDVAGRIGSGASFSRSLPRGTHVITASATDADDATGSTSVSISVAGDAPTVSIQAPSDGAAVRTADTVAFRGSASDADDGDLTGSIVWTSNRDGQIGLGGTFSRKLSRGTHTITATVTDSDGLRSSASVIVTVANTPPSVSITSPVNAAAFRTSDAISLQGTASDFDDGGLSGSIAWTSSRDGALGTGATLTRTLSKGTHTITATVADANGSRATATVTITVGNSAPTVSISSPSSGSSFLTSSDISFRGTASDFDDGALTGAIVWTSSRDGQIGVGGTFTRKLSKGTHTITARVTDADGASTSATVTVTVANTPPTVSIANPANGATFKTSDSIQFSGSGSDFDQGSLSGSLSWTSSKDGALGTGASFTRRLSKGTHVITATVTDADGATRSAQVTISVANTPPSVSISSPLNGATFKTSDSIQFSGSASDFDQGSLSGSLSWTSSKDGALGTGANFTRRLSKGTHVITATVTDADGASTSATVAVTVANTPPTVSIANPANGATFKTSDSIQFSGSASDFDQGSLSGSLSWTSSKDGALGTGSSLARRLSKGTHVITATVTDADGATASASVTVTVVNTPPTVAISSPTNNAAFRVNEVISFSATASDFDQGSLAASVSWTSSIDGAIGTGGAFTRKLSRGTHVISASVTDADGATATARVTITVSNN